MLQLAGITRLLATVPDYLYSDVDLMIIQWGGKYSCDEGGTPPTRVEVSFQSAWDFYANLPRRCSVFVEDEPFTGIINVYTKTKTTWAMRSATSFLLHRRVVYAVCNGVRSSCGSRVSSMPLSEASSTISTLIALYGGAGQNRMVLENQLRSQRSIPALTVPEGFECNDTISSEKVYPLDTCPDCDPIGDWYKGVLTPKPSPTPPYTPDVRFYVGNERKFPDADARMGIRAVQRGRYRETKFNPGYFQDNFTSTVFTQIGSGFILEYLSTTTTLSQPCLPSSGWCQACWGSPFVSTYTHRFKTTDSPDVPYPGTGGARNYEVFIGKPAPSARTPCENRAENGVSGRLPYGQQYTHTLQGTYDGGATFFPLFIGVGQPNPGFNPRDFEPQPTDCRYKVSISAVLGFDIPVKIKVGGVLIDVTARLSLQLPLMDFTVSGPCGVPTALVDLVSEGVNYVVNLGVDTVIRTIPVVGIAAANLLSTDIQITQL